MTRVVRSPQDFIIIGENIHATRAFQRSGRRVVTLPDGSEAIPFKGPDSQQRYLKVPESYKSSQHYQDGQIKHMLIAIRKGLSNDPAEQAEGTAYVQQEALRQVAAGAHFLDLNVDELSFRTELGKKAMEWLVRTVQAVSTVPLSIDSSNVQVIAAGLAAYDGRAGRPLVNSVALERLETLDLVKEHNARVVVTAAGREGMPQDADERVKNVGEVMEATLSRDIPRGDIFIDALVFPISVSPQYGLHYLDAVRQIRQTYGPEVHITGGISNVSFGLPRRQLINYTFMCLGMEAGLDSGIIDPIQNRVSEAFSLDQESEPVRLARDMLTGKDEYCVSYIQAWRQGRLG